MSSDVKYNVNAGFFDAINEDRTYSADDMNRPYRRLVSNGVLQHQRAKHPMIYKYFLQIME